MSKSARVNRAAAESHESQHAALRKDFSVAKYTITVAPRKALRQILIDAGSDAELQAVLKPKG